MRTTSAKVSTRGPFLIISGNPLIGTILVDCIPYVHTNLRDLLERGSLLERGDRR